MMASAMSVERGKLPVGVHLTHEIDGWMDAFRSVAEVRSYSRIDTPITAAVPVLQVPPTPVQSPTAPTGLAAAQLPRENGAA
jgi:hypothetical protein